MRGNQDLGSCDADLKTCPGMAGMSSCWSSNSPLPKHTILRGCNRNQFFCVARPLLFRTPSTPALGSLEPQGFCGQVKSWVSNAFHPVPKKQMMIPILQWLWAYNRYLILFLARGKFFSVPRRVLLRNDSLIRLLTNRPCVPCLPSSCWWWLTPIPCRTMRIQKLALQVLASCIPICYILDELRYPHHRATNMVVWVPGIIGEIYDWTRYLFVLR